MNSGQPKSVESENKGVVLTESNGELNSLREGIDQKVAEVAEINGENSSGASDDQVQKKSDFFGFTSISGQIRSLVTKKGKKDVPLPSVAVQTKLVEKSIKKEQKKLFRKAKRIQQSRRFSASELERVILQIRYLQKLLSELISAAAETIESLYKKFVLKVS